MVDLENNAMLPSLTSHKQTTESFTNYCTAVPHALCGQPSVMFPHPNAEEKLKATNNTGTLKRKKGEGGGVGNNCLVAHNWAASPARTVVEIISD